MGEGGAASARSSGEVEVVEVFFDYTCPFTDLAHQWLDTVTGVALRWRPFSLLERNYRGDGPSVWRRSDRADDISLLLFAGHHLVRAEGGDLDRYRCQALHAWHHSGIRPDLDAIVAIAADAGTPADPSAVRAYFRDAEADHAAAAILGVFGTPTLVYPDQTVAFVKLDTLPAAGRAQPLWNTLRLLARDGGALREWQRVTDHDRHPASR